MCFNEPYHIFHICSNYAVKKQRQGVTNFVKRTYDAHFGIKLTDHDKT